MILSGRKSYGKDILFSVERIIKGSKNSFAILKGLTVRIEADSPLDDLEIVEKEMIDKHIRILNHRLQDRIQKCTFHTRENRSQIEYTGKILHLDGDRRYGEKSAKYYKELGLNAIVKNIPESKQPGMIKALLSRYNPDIVVITGHDAMLKNGRNYNDIYNYRNSRYFINTVLIAREWEKETGHEIAIFAGACQSFFEAIMSSGANFASSPARILIDFIDPLIVAEKIATTEEYKYITIGEIAGELRDGIEGIGGIGSRGKKALIIT